MLLLFSAALWCLVSTVPSYGQDCQAYGADCAAGTTLELVDEDALYYEDSALVQARLGLRSQQHVKLPTAASTEEGEQLLPSHQEQLQQHLSLLSVAAHVTDLTAAYASNLAALYAYPVFAAIVAFVVVLAYGSRGVGVVSSILCYITALSSIKLTVKWVFVHYSFPYAKLVTATHFTLGALLAFGILRYRTAQFPIPTLQEFWLMIFPVSLAVVISVSAGNMSLVHSSAAFTEIVGATTPFFTVLMILFLGMPFQLNLLLPLGLVILGCVISTVGEIHFSFAGFVLCCVANLFRSLKVALQQKLMTGETKDKFDPVALLFWICTPSIFVMLTASLVTEGLMPYQHMTALETSQKWGLVRAILISCANATVLNLAQLFVNKDLGAVGSQLVAQAKSVLTILGGVVIFAEVVSQMEIFGFMMVLLGVYLYSWMEQRAKQLPVAADLAKQPSLEHVAWTPGK